MRAILVGWYVYLAVLAALLSASAGRRTLVGALAVAAAAAAVLLLVMMIRWPFGAFASTSLAAKSLVLLAGVAGLAARREDTRLIALMLAAAAVLPIVLHFWQPGQALP